MQLGLFSQLPSTLEKSLTLEYIARSKELE